MYIAFGWHCPPPGKKAQNVFLGLIVLCKRLLVSRLDVHFPLLINDQSILIYGILLFNNLSLVFILLTGI